MFGQPKLPSGPFGLVTLAPPFNYDPGVELIGGDVLTHTENGVFTRAGRYFVAAEHADPNLGWGIYEVVKTASGYAVDQVLPGVLEVASTEHKCWFHGLATDGDFLYATAAVHLEGKPEKMDYGALFRILPKEKDPKVSFAPYEASEIHFFNGMAVGPDGAVYMSNSQAVPDRSNVAIFKAKIQDRDGFEIRIEPWLHASMLRDTGPNGIQVKDETMYYVSGKWLYRIAIGQSGPGPLVPIYLAMIPNNSMDDLTILPDGRVAVGEIDLLAHVAGFEGWGINQIVTVDPTGVMPLNQKFTLTSPYTVSSLAYSDGNLFTPGKLIATSWFHGGIREIGVS